MKTVLETLHSGTDYLQKRGVENPRLNMQLLLAHVLECSQLDLYLEFDRPLDERELGPLRELLKRRGQRVPLQHLLGEVAFCGRTFRCDARALIPRPETEELVEAILKARPSLPGNSRVIDVGTGSGVIGLSLAAAWSRPDIEIVLSDQEEAALSLAAENRGRFDPQLVIRLCRSDLLDAFPMHPPFAVIAANLPYIPHAEIADLEPEVRCDPPSALDGGADGLDFVNRLVDQARDRLEDGGLLALELGQGQAPAVAGHMRNLGYRDVAVLKDLNSIERMILATK